MGGSEHAKGHRNRNEGIGHQFGTEAKTISYTPYSRAAVAEEPTKPIKYKKYGNYGSAGTDNAQILE